MSNTKKSVGGGSDRKTGKRNLPSWTSSREKDEKSIGKKPYRDGDDDGGDEGEKREQANGCGKGRSGTTDFSKLLVLNYCELGPIILHGSVSQLSYQD